ncbi:MFS transporter [Actinomycetospora straminea]|uniref:MFS transporter n=1 Tax=Actinomycetospora straminea TaxID=663607 RepID=A0ABP9F2G8_9PSEU|nr:MFS transporter [Actinomycetospora straminea]MDD7934879.1 MFS transporter [Actinomycetospora straminea]
MTQSPPSRRGTGRDEPSPAAVRRVALASLVGTTIEWYDFFIYASAAGLVFSQLFFTALDPSTALLASFATIGVSFIARPLGGVVAGHLGDRLGRKGMLVATLLIMGLSTVGVGLLPTYAAIGVAAPILLLVLRLLQGLSAGGEWGGAALMAVEHAPPGRRGFFGTYPQVGVPIGLVLANLVFLLVSTSTSREQFLAWGWRIPFLLSIVLVFVGLFVRARVDESPVFTQLREQRARRSAPMLAVLRDQPRALLVAIGLFIANNMIGYLLIAFITSYGTRVLGLPSSTMLAVGIAGAVVWGVAIVWSGSWSDRVGRRRVYLVGTILLLVWSFPFFLLLDTASLPWMLLAVAVLGVGLGLTYGPQAAAYAELFPAPVRYSGASFAYAVGAVLGGGFAPLVAQALIGATGTSLSVSVYMVIVCLITLAAVLALREGSAEEREAFVVGT